MSIGHSKPRSARYKGAEPVLRLEDMHGYGPAKDWDLRLAEDLQDWREGRLAWSEVDRGLLLSGPTGVGRTISARALAETCYAHTARQSGKSCQMLKIDLTRVSTTAPRTLTYHCENVNG